jgi:hypothetical protein
MNTGIARAILAFFSGPNDPVGKQGCTQN